MKFSNTNFYFETSAVNHFVNKYRWQDAVATQELQTAKGNRWYLSPVTLSEILMTKDEEIREQIIFFSQHLFHHQLIASPSELILNFMKAGCPLVEPKYDFHTKLHLGSVWTNLCVDKRRTFQYDYVDVKDKATLLHGFAKQIDRIINEVYTGSEVNEVSGEYAFQQVINHYYNQIAPELSIEDEDHEKVVRISLWFMIYILCIGVEFDNTPVHKFWEDLKINDPFDRISFILIEYPDLMKRSPFLTMALMAYHQMSQGQKSNRGLFMDSLHSVYLTYVGLFITNDNHFKSLKEKDLHPVFNRILHITEMNLQGKYRKVNTPK